MSEQKQYDTAYIENLQNKYNALLTRSSFKERDIVVWKNGLRNKQLPNEGQPAIVLEVLDEPIIDNSQDTAASPYFREPLDVLVMLDDDGDLVSFYYDSRRFEQYKS